MSSASASEHTHDSTLEKKGDDYTYARINLTEDDLDGLMHGDGFTVEWQLEDETLAVAVKSPREFDMDWLRRTSDAFDDPPRRGLLSRLIEVVLR